MKYLAGVRLQLIQHRKEVPGLRKRLTPKWVERYAAIYKTEGFKGVLKKGGIWLVVGFILFYLIRDSVLYLLLPYLIAKGAFSLF